MFIERRDTGARIEQEQRHIGVGDGFLGLSAHASFKRLDIDVFKAGRVDDGEGEYAEGPNGFAPVAGDPRPVVHDGFPTADQTVEERGLADVRAADDGHREGGARIAALLARAGKLRAGGAAGMLAVGFAGHASLVLAR